MTSSAIVPMLAYDDAPAAIDFLCRAFGFEERFRLPMPDGTIGHAELALEGTDATINVATTWRDGGMAPPEELPAVHSQVQCHVPDVDAHYARAKAAGATVIAVPEDQFYGARIYRAIDLEGHRWIFSQQLREVSEEEMLAAVESPEGES